MRDSETPVMEVTRLAVERINQQGGILGRRVVPVVVDGQSNWNVFEDGARRLITDEKVSVIFGCWTSASRRTVKPVLEELDHLLIYPVQYEGLESSPNIFYIGASPNQQITPAFQWLMGNKLSKRFYLVGSDYVFPRSANAILNDRITEAELTIVGERYIPLGSADVADIVSDIVATKPDVILNTINGDSNVAFFRELRKAGITPQDIPTVSFSIAEHELRSMNISEMAGDLAAWNYFQSIDNEENEEFVQLIKERYGQERVVTDPMEAAWIGVHLWAQAVKEAGTDEVTAVREAMKEQTFNAPSGTISINPENQHAYKVPRIGEITDTGQFEIQFVGVRPINPEPYPQTRTREEWTQFLDDLYNGWGGNWAAPAK
jgi:urea transport system substrate-binding protein